MYHYSRKIGKWKFWLLACLSLIYYLGNIDIINLLFLITSSTTPHLLLIVQVLLGGAKQMGEDFFALAFIIISMKIDGERLKYYLLITSTGMMSYVHMSKNPITQRAHQGLVTNDYILEFNMMLNQFYLHKDV